MGLTFRNKPLYRAALSDIALGYSGVSRLTELNSFLFIFFANPVFVYRNKVV